MRFYTVKQKGSKTKYLLSILHDRIKKKKSSLQPALPIICFSRGEGQ